jgi:hypothetical protein
VRVCVCGGGGVVLKVRDWWGLGGGGGGFLKRCLQVPPLQRGGGIIGYLR